MSLVTTRAKDLVGRWQITELSELDERYFEESDEPPFISIHPNKSGRVHAEHHFGLSHGEFPGDICEFGGEPVLVFGCAGSDEMDAVNSAGWAQLRNHDQLEEAFLGVYGGFIATREHEILRRPRSHRSGPNRDG